MTPPGPTTSAVDEAFDADCDVAGRFRGSFRTDRRFRLDVFCDPFDGASGDLVKVRQTAGHLRLVVADACGHGRDAAEILRGAAKAAEGIAVGMAWTSPADVLAKLSAAFADQPFTRRGAFVTSLVMVLDLASGDVRLALAGHPPPILVRAGRAVDHDWRSAALPLGLIDESAASDVTFRMQPGDTLIAYTDGFPDARAADGSSLGWDGARALLVAAVADVNPVASAEARLDAMNSRHWRRDDTTAAFLRFAP